MGSYRVCLCFTRKFREAEMEVPGDVKELFEKYTTGGHQMSVEQLSQFLADQGGGSDSDDAAGKVVEEVLQRRRHHWHNRRISRNNGLSLEDFFFLLFSVELNPAIDSSKVVQDMTAPLSHYFIYTGHNSYLTGNQLSSNCSDVPIIKALERGVRVIELDLWPNSSKDNNTVHVLHGRTLTTPVELSKCLKSIKEHAFSASPYPVILTLEDHLTPDLQANVAQMLTDTFGEALYYPDQSECLKEFPSPEDLKHRIIISTKPPKEYLATQFDEHKLITSMNKDSNTVTDKAQSIKEQDKAADGIEENADNLIEFEGDEDDSSKESGGDDNSSKTPPPVYKHLNAMPTIPRHNLKEALKGDPEKAVRLSLSEETLEKSANLYGEALVRFTQRNIVRVFPKTTRFNSSNYKPTHGWTHGAQMVAFNMQGHGKYLWLMQGFFKANGGCGYVKKPEFLLNANQVFSPKADMAIKTTLKVKIYMGTGWNIDFKHTHFDKYSPPDFYTKIGIVGVPADESTTQKTKIKEDEWTPYWNEEFEFPLRVPELALLRIQVDEYDVSEKDDFAGQTCLPVWELRSGVRAVPLYNLKGEPFESVKLLVRFQFI